MNKTTLILTHVGAFALGAGVTYAICKTIHDKKVNELNEEFVAYMDQKELDIWQEATERLESEIKKSEERWKGLKELANAKENVVNEEEYDKITAMYKAQEPSSTNVFDTAAREVEEEIDKAKQEWFEEGKNHILDDQEDYWDHNNPERDLILGSESRERKTHTMSYDEFMRDRGTPIREMTYYANDDVLIDDTTDEFSNKLFDTTVGWDWLDDVNPDERFVYLLDGPSNVIYQIDYIYGSYSEKLFDGHRDHSV